MTDSEQSSLAKILNKECIKLSVLNRNYIIEHTANENDLCGHRHQRRELF